MLRPLKLKFIIKTIKMFDFIRGRKSPSKQHEETKDEAPIETQHESDEEENKSYLMQQPGGRGRRESSAKKVAYSGSPSQTSN